MTEQTQDEKQEHTYKCPHCDCEFTAKPGEQEVCRCDECGREVDPEKTGCTCCQ